ncbi:hypothetical protein STCU_12081 [Strigomonas culicis]|uniref:Uncharacterized protein n=1 Tax=Strigomonas culicis TaxID=28005 RepID=S9UL05_9TRYP|nr:hypothetical protein STCU_12081 [Strigomonas culicis]|eukprot:EPY15366.1 hypothetical protein STCU_12081 [Strigomonas culicis]
MTSRPDAPDVLDEADLNEARILRQEVELQELLVRQLQQRKAVRDEMLRRLRAAMHTSESFDFAELTNDAEELLHEIEERHVEAKKQPTDSTTDPTPADSTLVVEDGGGVTMDALIGIEDDGRKAKKKRKRNRRKKAGVDGPRHVDPSATEAPATATVATAEERREAAQRAALFAALETVHFDRDTTAAPPLGEEGPAWLREEEPALVAEDEYSDDFEDYQEEEREEPVATGREEGDQAEEERKEAEQK